jgi:hypothetical protein
LSITGCRRLKTAPGTVLIARPTALEANLSYVVLGDLLRDVAWARQQLAAPRRRALDIALLDTEPDW